MLVTCQKYSDRGSRRVFSMSDDYEIDQAPDEYVNRFFDMKPGDVVFVEGLKDDDLIHLWRVERVDIPWPGVCGYVTKRVTLVEMQKETT